MVNTKYNFRKYLREKYPHIIAQAIYGIPAYILSASLDDQDAFYYQQQQLPTGQYVAFIHSSDSQVAEWMKLLQQGTIPTSSYANRNTPAPTTFSAFQLWIQRHNKPALNRVYCHKTTPRNIFHTDQIHNCPMVDIVGNWYMYEFLSTEEDERIFARVPWVQIEGTTIVLAKASPTNYVSKKEAFAQMVRRLTPLYESIVVLCAKEQWDEAKQKAEEYMMIQFEYPGTIDIDKMKEAYNDHLLSLFLRNREFYTRANEEVPDEEDF